MKKVRFNGHPIIRTYNGDGITGWVKGEDRHIPENMFKQLQIDFPGSFEEINKEEITDINNYSDKMVKEIKKKRGRPKIK